MLFCLTANHRNTEFDVLDRISRVVDSSAAELLAAHDSVRGAVVLATCNRFEAYLDLDEASTGEQDAAEMVLETIRRAAGADADALRASAVALSGDQVVRHLFAVSSGLESMVIGEDEISGQVQRALTAARAAGTTSGRLEQAFQRAAHATREIRAQADLGAAGRSLARLALDLAESRIADWASARILIVGTGSYAATTIAALRARGARDVRVFSATGRAARFSARYGTRAEPELTPAIGDADVVITCTARYTVTADQLPEGARLLVVDLGLPRNVDPAVGELPGVELLDLEIIGLHASVPSLGRAGAHELVGSAAAAFMAERAAAPAIVALRGHVQGILDAEIERLRARGGDGQAEAALRHFAGVLLHGPSVRAREQAAAGRLAEFEKALELVFGAEVAAHAAARRRAGADVADIGVEGGASAG